MTDHAWKAEERRVARLIGGTRYPANSGGRVDVESPRVVAQVKHVRQLSLSALEQLAMEVTAIGAQRRKLGVVVIKRKAGRGQPTTRLVLMTEAAFWALDQSLAGSEPEEA